MSTSGVYPMRGVIQHYQWGGTEFLPELLQSDNPDHEPWAEYWLGVHPKGMATVTVDGKQLPLADFLADRPDLLGPEVCERFGELPFLLKILDVQAMLSIQLHPTREAARRGYAREEAAGIPRLAPHRNYKDENHKPEVMVALSDFWLLHGFKSATAIAESLASVPTWAVLLPILERRGVAGLYAYVMQLPAAEVFQLLDPLYQSLVEQHAQLHPDGPDYWAWQAFEQYSTTDFHDRGVFSIYWLNLIRLAPGEGIFQDAGIPHAYLRGTNVELMANSDNVLRGGLTPKHIDAEALLQNIDFRTVHPHVLTGEEERQGGWQYPVPVDDFALRRYELSAGQTLRWRQRGPAIYLMLEGALIINTLILEKSEAVFVGQNTLLEFAVRGSEKVVFFVASVGLF